MARAKCGDKFGMWTVLETFKKPIRLRNFCRCRCKCGREYDVMESDLKNQGSTRCKNCNAAVSAVTHGLSYEKTYYKWNNIMQCCYNPKNPSFHLYGGRGIKMCDEWLSVTNFYEYMGDMPQGNTLRRIDPDGDFEPGNCIWLSK